MKILLKNGFILRDVHSEPEICDLLIEDGKIAAIGKVSEESTCEVYDISNKLVVPGFVNAHTHAAMTLMRGYAEDLRLKEWLFERILPVEEKLTEQDVYYGTMLAQMEMAKRGVVAYADMYFHCDSVARAALDFGMKVLITRGLIDLDSERGRLKQNVEYYEKWDGKNGLIKVGFGPHAPYSCSIHYIDEIARVALKLQAPVMIHLYETNQENYELRDILQTSLRECKVLFAHCVHVKDSDIRLLANENFFVVHNPTSNLKLGSGIAPISKFLSSNVQVCLGTDGAASNNSLDVWHEMRLAVLLQKLMDPRNLSVEQALTMAIEQGAKALGLSPGRIEIGSDADLIVIDLNKPWYVPRKKIKTHLVHAGCSSDVFATMVKGQWIYYDGKFPTVDERYILKKCEEAIERLIGTTN